jgi:hypothetical protein
MTQEAQKMQIETVEKLGWKCDWLCEKWSEEAVDFSRRRLEREGKSHILSHYELGPSRIRDKVASLVAGRDVSVPILVPKFIPITHGITSAELRRLVGDAEIAEEIPGNLLLNEGIQRLMDMTMIATVTTNQTATNPWSNANSFIGVGDTATAEAATQTELQAAAAATNRFYKAMNATYPSRANQTSTFQSDFTTTEANFAWQEWTIAASTTTASGAGFLTGTINLNRKVAALGTKATGTWTLSGAVTIS